MLDTGRLTIQATWEDQSVLNFQAARILHRHGNEWVELTPVADHSPDPRDPERQLIHHAQVFRCRECDEEVQIAPRERSG